MAKSLMTTPYAKAKRLCFFPILHFNSGSNLTSILLLDVLPHNSFLRNSIFSPQGLFEIKEKEVANSGSWSNFHLKEDHCFHYPIINVSYFPLSGS